MTYMSSSFSGARTGQELVAVVSALSINYRGIAWSGEEEQKIIIVPTSYRYLVKRWSSTHHA
jgi:hypothetical protein